MRTARLKHRIDRHLKDDQGDAIVLSPDTEYVVKEEFKGPKNRKMTRLIVSKGRTVSLPSGFLKASAFSAN